MIDLIDKGLQRLTNDLIITHTLLGQRCSGKWIESLHIREGKNEMSIWGAFYTTYLVYGRPPSAKLPPYEAIRKWIECKGLAVGLDDKKVERLTWAIMHKIARKGTKWWRWAIEGKPSIADIVFDKKNIDRAFRELYENWDKDIFVAWRVI